MRQSHLLFIDLVRTARGGASALDRRDNFEFVRPRRIDAEPHLGCILVAALPTLGTGRSVRQVMTMTDHLRTFAPTIATVISAFALGFVSSHVERIARALPALPGLLVLLFSPKGAHGVMGLCRAALEQPTRPGASKSMSAYNTALIVGLGVRVHLHSQSLAHFASHRIRIAGVLGQGGRRARRSIHGHPILATPAQVADALGVLAIHGVIVDSIVVMTTFERMSPQAQSALLEIEKASNVSFELLADPMGAQVTGSREISTADKSVIEIRCVTNASLALVFEIVLRIISIVAFGERMGVVAIERAWRTLQQAAIYRKTKPATERLDLVSFIGAKREGLAT